MGARALVRRVVHSRLFPQGLRARLLSRLLRRRLARQSRIVVMPQIEAGPCRICGGKLFAHRDGGHAYNAVWDGRYAQVFACGSCSHKQFLPDLTDKDLASVYSTGYFVTDSERQLYVDLYALDYNATVNEIHASLAEWGMTGGYRLHEFGCGTGLSVHQLRKKGVDATGSDWSTIAIGFGQEQGNAHISLENLNTVKEMMGTHLDVIFTNHVIEHLPNPVAFLSGLKPLMGENSLVIMRFPNGDGAINRALGMFYDPLFYFPHHIHYFSPKSITIAAERAGLKVLSVKATTRAVPDLLDAAKPELKGDIHARLRAAADSLDTEELEVVFALQSSHRYPLANVEAAVARGVAAVEPGRVARWNNHDGFYINEGAIWRFRALLEEGDTQLSPTGDVPMGFSPQGGYWHYGDAAIGDHWLQSTPEKGRPALDFVAPETGSYHFEVDMAARFMGGPPICLSATAKGQALWNHVLSRPTPYTERFDLSLNAGEAVTFIASNPPGAGMQRAVCFVKVDLA
jgi:SAM-dependent methyltransferase